MKVKTLLCAVIFSLIATPALAQSPDSFEGLVKASINALKAKDQAAFMALFITPDEMLRSVQEDTHLDDKKEKKAAAKRFAKGGKERIMTALTQARASAWGQLNPGGLDWSKARVLGVEPAFNRADGVEKTDWARITIQAGQSTYLLNLNQARKTKDGWRLVYGGKVKGPLPKPEKQKTENQ